MQQCHASSEEREAFLQKRVLVSFAERWPSESGSKCTCPCPAVIVLRRTVVLLSMRECLLGCPTIRCWLVQKVCTVDACA